MFTEAFCTGSRESFERIWRVMVPDRSTREGEEPQSAAYISKQSDEAIVPVKQAKTEVTAVESVEGRAEAKRKSERQHTPATQSEISVKGVIERIGTRARKKSGDSFNNLLSHIKVPFLKEAFRRLRKDGAEGVDGMTWEAYAEELPERLADVVSRIHRGTYQPQPVKRVHIPKGDGKTRPLGIPTLEDKLVQMAVKMLLEPIYEAEFLEFSYGFRPKKSAHNALDALAYAVTKQKVNWVLDADIRAFFDTISHEWMQKFVEHKIKDTRLVRLVMKFMSAGVMEDGTLHEAKEGTPQGGIISPLLANIYLHYVFDLWIRKEAKRCTGDVVVVRYADDFVVAFQKEEEAKGMLKAIAERMQKFGLELHADKTRVIEFGRYAKEHRKARGEGKPETFDFLGFTHIASRDRHDKGFQLKRYTSRKKRRQKLKVISEACHARKHRPVEEQHRWLRSVLVGHFNYYAVPTNYYPMLAFKTAVEQCWLRALERRSQRAKMTWKAKKAHLDRFPLPPPKIKHPWPDSRFLRPLTQGGSLVRVIRSQGSVRGAP